MNRTATTSTALLTVALLGLAAVPTSLADDDYIPDEVEAALCGTPVPPEGTCNEDDLNVWAFPMETVLGPVCDATENEPAEVCLLRFFTLGQAVCMLRSQAPANGAVLVCSGGHVLLHCDSTVPAEMVAAFLSDADCDGYGNVAEVEQGCDPLDAQSHPIGPMECSEGSGGANPADLVGCSGSEDALDIVSELVSDADCDGYSNVAELEQGCNPLDAADHPGLADGCAALPVPDVGEIPDPGELPVDPSELPVDPSELPVDPSELPVDPSELPI